MADGIEVARAFVTIIPAYEKGIQKDITTEIVGASEGAGDQAGTALAASMGASMGRGLKKAMVGLGGLLAGGALVKGVYGIGASFDAMTDTIIVGTGASGEALEELRQSAIDIAKQVPISFEQAGDYVQDLNTRLGLTGENLEDVAVQLAKIENITGEGVDVEAFSGAMSIWGESADEMATDLDYLFVVSQSTGIGMNDLISILEKTAPQMQSLGYSFEETAAMAGLLDVAGLDASQMMGQLGRAAVNLAKDGEEPAEALERNVEEIGRLLDAGDRAGALDLAAQLFGTRGANQFLEAVETGALDIDEFTESIGDYSGAIDETYQATADFAERFQTLKNNLAALLEPIATPLFNAINDALSSLSQWMSDHAEELQPIFDEIGQAFGELSDKVAPAILDSIIPALEKFRDLLTWVNDHGELVKKILIGLAGAFLITKLATTFAPALQALSMGFGKLGTTVPKAGKAAATSAGQMLALGASLLMVGGAIALAGLGFKMMAEAAVQLADAGGVAIAVFFGMIGAIIGIGAALLIAAPGLTAAAPGLLAFGAAMLMVAGAIAVVTLAISYLVEVLAANAPQLVELMQGAADAFVTACDGIAQAVSDVVTAIADGATQIIDAVSNLVTSVGDAISGVLDSLAGVFDSIGNAALNAGTGMDMLVNALIRLTNDTKLADLAASTKEAASGIKRMSEAAGDGAGLNAVATAVQTLGTMGMLAASSTMLIAQGMMLISAQAAAASAAVTAFVSAIVSSGSQLSGAAASIRTFAGSQMVIQSFSRNAVSALKAFGVAAQTYSNQAATAVRVAMASIAATVSGTRLQMQPINLGRLPHFRFEGQFNVQTGQVPALRVDWYGSGAVFGEPTIIGVGDSASPEIVTPRDLMADTFDESLEGSGIREEIRGLREDVRNVRLYLDGNALVGGIADRMDTRLGMMQTASARGF